MNFIATDVTLIDLLIDCNGHLQLPLAGTRCTSASQTTPQPTQA
jgi:hypothetical protein